LISLSSFVFLSRIYISRSFKENLYLIRSYYLVSLFCTRISAGYVPLIPSLFVYSPHVYISHPHQAKPIADFKLSSSFFHPYLWARAETEPLASLGTHCLQELFLLSLLLTCILPANKICPAQSEHSFQPQFLEGVAGHLMGGPQCPVSNLKCVEKGIPCAS